MRVSRARDGEIVRVSIEQLERIGSVTERDGLTLTYTGAELDGPAGYCSRDDQDAGRAGVCRPLPERATPRTDYLSVRGGAERISTYPSVPCTRIRCPSRIRSGGALHPHDGRQAVLPCDHRAMGHQAPDLRHQALDRDEQGCPARVRVGGDEDVARFEVGLRHVQDDAGPPLDGPGGNRQADQRAGRHVVASVCPCDDLAVRREHPGRRERPIRRERVLAPADELVVHPVRPHDVDELPEREVEDVFLLAKHVSLHEPLGFCQ